MKLYEIVDYMSKGHADSGPEAYGPEVPKLTSERACLEQIMLLCGLLGSMVYEESVYTDKIRARLRQAFEAWESFPRDRSKTSPAAPAPTTSAGQTLDLFTTCGEHDDGA